MLSEPPEAYYHNDDVNEANVSDSRQKIKVQLLISFQLFQVHTVRRQRVQIVRSFQNDP